MEIENDGSSSVEGSPAPEAAPQTTESNQAGDNTGNVAEPQVGEQGSRVSRRGNPEYARQRIERRETMRRMEALERAFNDRFSKFEQMLGQGNAPSKEDLSDPEVYAKYLEERIASRLEKRSTEQGQRQEAVQAKRDAYEWLMSQAGVKDSEEVQEELSAIFDEDDEVAELLESNPRLAAKVAYSMLGLSARKVDPKAKARASASVKPSSSSPGQARQWTKASVDQFAKTASDAEFKKYEQEILALARAGKLQ